MSKICDIMICADVGFEKHTIKLLHTNFELNRASKEKVPFFELYSSYISGIKSLTSGFQSSVKLINLFTQMGSNLYFVTTSSTVFELQEIFL